MRRFTYYAKSPQDKEKIANIRADIILRLPHHLRRVVKTEHLFFTPTKRGNYKIQVTNSSSSLQQHMSNLRIKFANDKKLS